MDMDLYRPLHNKISTGFLRRWCPDPTKIHDLEEIYVQFNARYFNGELPVLKTVVVKTPEGEEIRDVSRSIKWNHRFRRLYGRFTPRTQLIELSSKNLALNPTAVRSTLLHEMLHKYLFVRGEDDGIMGHGPNFCREAARINAQVEKEDQNYRVHFHEREVEVPVPAVMAKTLSMEFHVCGDLDIANACRSVMNAGFGEDWTRIQ